MKSHEIELNNFCFQAFFNSSLNKLLVFLVKSAGFCDNRFRSRWQIWEMRYNISCRSCDGASWLTRNNQDIGFTINSNITRWWQPWKPSPRIKSLQRFSKIFESYFNKKIYFDFIFSAEDTIFISLQVRYTLNSRSYAYFWINITFWTFGVNQYRKSFII